MKNIIMTLAIAIFAIGTLAAQSSDNYRSRNHKLNKNHKTVINETNSNVVMAKVDIQADVYDYLKRNSKFHKTTDEKRLFIAKDRIAYDYKALNRKFKKGQQRKLNSNPATNDVLSQK